MRVLRCAGLVSERFLGCRMSLGFCDFSPTHTPPPLSRPAGRKRGASFGRVFKGGKSELDGALPSKWQQCRPEVRRSISAQHPLALKGLQPIENPLSQFDGNAPKLTFFSPSKTRPNVAVSSLSAPKGVQKVGVRGGIQRIKIKNAADNRVEGSSHPDRFASEPCKRDPKK